MNSRQTVLAAHVMVGLLTLAALGDHKTIADDNVAADVPPNTWVDAEAEYPLPESIPDAKWVTTDGYCGSTYRSKTGTILFRSGVRSKQKGLSPGFYSNATLAWDLASNKIHVVEISRFGGGSYGGGQLLEGFHESPTPSPRHTYDGLTYVEGEDAMYFMLGANWRTTARNHTEEAKEQLAVDNASTWRYAFAEGRWHRIDHNIRKFWSTSAASPYESHLQHWPEGRRLLFLDSTGRRYAEFDLETKRWEQLETKNPCPVSPYNARSTWDSKRGLWVFRLGPEVCTFDPRDKEFTMLPLAYAMPDEKDPRRRWKGIVYIPKHDVYLITGPTGDDTHVFDIGKCRWSTVRGGPIELVNGYPQYDPKTDLVGLVYQLSALKFRYVQQ